MAMDKSLYSQHDDSQLLLFPRSPHWPDDAYSVIDHPAPGLARVTAAPLFKLNNSQQPGDALRCFAVTADRQFAALVTVSIGDMVLLDSSCLWQRVHEQVEIERASMREMSNDWSMQTPVDCFARWCNPTAWLYHGTTDPIHPLARAMAARMRERSICSVQELVDTESSAQLAVARLIKEGVGQVLDAMDPALESLLVARPNLSMAVVHGLIRLARQCCNNGAMRFVMQALKTESISLLALARSASVDADGKTVLDAICNGSSLPRALQTIGVAKAIHRRTIRCAERGLAANSGVICEVSEFPLSGRNWRIIIGLAQQLPFQLWPKMEDQWRELIAVAMVIHDFHLGSKVLTRLLRWCASGHFLDASKRLTLLLKQAQALTTAADELGGIELNPESAILIALNMAPINSRRGDPLKQVEDALDTQQVGRTVVELALFTGLDLEPWVASVFTAHPNIPRTYQADPHIDVQALTTFRGVVDHGSHSGICLQDEATAIQYVACGVALYAARGARGELLGTFGLHLKNDESRPTVEVSEVGATVNAMVSSSLYKFAAQLAQSFSVDSLDEWWTFVAQGDRFRQQAGAS